MRYYRKSVLLVIIFMFLACGKLFAAENVALNKPTTDNGHYSSGSVSYPSSNGVDGDYDTHWSWYAHGSTSNPGWFRVDLENTYSIDQINLSYSHDAGNVGLTNIYNLYTSLDDVTWELIHSGTLVEQNTLGTSNPDNITSILFDPFEVGRFVKYEVVGGTHWAGLKELEVYGTVTPEPVSSVLFFLGGATMVYHRRKKKYNKKIT